MNLSNIFYFYGIDFIDSTYVDRRHYYISQNVTSFTLYYVDSYTDSNTFLSKIYPNKNSTTTLKDCSLIKLGDYFSIIYCTLTWDYGSYFE